MHLSEADRSWRRVSNLRVLTILVVGFLVPGVLHAGDAQPSPGGSQGFMMARGNSAPSTKRLVGIEPRLSGDVSLQPAASSPAGVLSTNPPKTGLARTAPEEFSLSEPMAQTGCTLCLTGNSTATWNGSSGSFHVDYIQNNRSSATNSLQLKIVLTSSTPVFGQPISYWNFSDAVVLSPLPAGYQYSNVNSGTISFYPSTIPAGSYSALLLLNNYNTSTSTWGYTDWMTYNSRITCNGASCAAAQTCVESATTMCLIGGRYRVTSQWTNQYAGGAVSTMNRATLTDATGAFWISDASTYEYVIRINTATNNGKAWIAILTFTDVEFSVLVEDLVGGQSKSYHSLPGNRDLIYDPLFFVYP